jgi:hypothetical protein
VKMQRARRDLRSKGDLEVQTKTTQTTFARTMRQSHNNDDANNTPLACARINYPQVLRQHAYTLGNRASQGRLHFNRCARSRRAPGWRLLRGIAMLHCDQFAHVRFPTQDIRFETLTSNRIFHYEGRSVFSHTDANLSYEQRCAFIFHYEGRLVFSHTDANLAYEQRCAFAVTQLDTVTNSYTRRESHNEEVFLKSSSCWPASDKCRDVCNNCWKESDHGPQSRPRNNARPNHLESMMRNTPTIWQWANR